MKHLLSFAMLLLLSGCFSGLHSDVPAVQTYVLRRPATPPTAPAAQAPLPTVQLARLAADPGLGSDRIVLVQADHRMGVFAGARWPGDLPEVVETLAIETLRASGAWAAVHEWPSAFDADYLLQVTIRRFEADYTQSDTQPTIYVSFDCTLSRRNGRQPIANFTAQASAAATENRLATVVAAFEQAANAALESMSARSSEVVRAQPPEPGPGSR